MKLTDHLRQYANEPITRQVLLGLLKDYKRPHDKIAELVSSGILIRIRRGLWVAGKLLAPTGPEPFLLANHMMGPSYVSLESALSYRGLIPESVVETSSVTTEKSKTYDTPLGRFSYSHLSLPYYAFGIRQEILADSQVAMLASAEKALCDKIITTSALQLRSQQQALQFLVEDMRIDEASLKELDTDMITGWIPDAPKKDSLTMLTQTLKSL